MVLAAIQGEFRRYRSLAERALSQLEDEQMLHVLGEDGNSIAILMQHLGSNLKSRFTGFLVSDGEKPWRYREGEFERRPMNRELLLAGWNEGWQLLEDCLSELDDSLVERQVFIRGQGLSVIEALMRSLSHVAYHVGQIVLLARWQKGTEWVSLSIPRGNSALYNLNPDRERPPA